MASLFPSAMAAEEALFHTEAVMAFLCHKASVASHSPKTVVEGTHRCTAVGGAGAVEGAVYVRNTPRRGPGVLNTAGTL